MEYDLGYHMRCKLPLSSGRSVILTSLYQWQAYKDSLGNAPPFREWNDRMLQEAIRRAQELARLEPFHLPPIRYDYYRMPGDHAGMTTVGDQSPEYLPRVMCVGVFRSFSPARDETKDYSLLAVLWHQNEYALPIDPAALQQIREIDWNSEATDYEW
jgi:hypothetical protein